jgi:ISXO2-like transposase domain
MSEKSLTDWFQKIGKFCKLLMNDIHGRQRQQWEECQFDITYFGRRKFGVGRIVKNTYVHCGARIQNNSIVACSLEMVSTQTKETLMKPIIKFVNPNNCVISTDSAKAYIYGIKEHFDGNPMVQHKFVNHSQNFVNSEGYHSNTVESLNSAVKRKMSRLFNSYTCTYVDATINRLALIEFLLNCKYSSTDPIVEIFRGMQKFNGHAHIKVISYRVFLQDYYYR